MSARDTSPRAGRPPRRGWALWGRDVIAALTSEDAVPRTEDATRPVVLRPRGRTRVGATLIEVLDNYADDLAEVGGRLCLGGADVDVAAQLRDTGKLDLEQGVARRRPWQTDGDAEGTESGNVNPVDAASVLLTA